MQNASTGELIRCSQDRSFSAIAGIVGLIIVPLALSGWPRSFAAEQPSDIPAWLKAHVGEGDGQIAPLVLQRARALYLQKVSEGAVKNPCYFAMDATRPAGFGRRFYVICEADQTFRAVPSGHGSGRSVAGANFTNGISCAKNFSNAMDSKLTTGGPYVTAEIRTSFKGYYRSAGKYVAFSRSFVQFDGEGDTANAETARHRRTSGRRVAGRVSAKGSGQSVRERGGLRSGWEAPGLRRRPQQWLHQLVARRRSENHPDDAGDRRRSTSILNRPTSTLSQRR